HTQRPPARTTARTVAPYPAPTLPLGLRRQSIRYARRCRHRKPAEVGREPVKSGTPFQSAFVPGRISAIMAPAIGPLYCLPMNTQLAISRVINLIPAETQRLWSIDESEARRRLIDGDVGAVLDIDGSFALVAQDGERVMLARG